MMPNFDELIAQQLADSFTRALDYSGIVKESTVNIPLAVQKFSAVQNISSELLPKPDTRTPEQKKADTERFLAKEAAKREAILTRHVAALEAADPVLRSVLELHAPVFGREPYSWAECDGCDVAGYEGEQPQFPCRTYELLVGAS